MRASSPYYGHATFGADVRIYPTPIPTHGGAGGSFPLPPGYVFPVWRPHSPLPRWLRHSPRRIPWGVGLRDPRRAVLPWGAQRPPAYAPPSGQVAVAVHGPPVPPQQLGVAVVVVTTRMVPDRLEVPAAVADAFELLEVRVGVQPAWQAPSDRQLLGDVLAGGAAIQTAAGVTLPLAPLLAEVGMWITVSARNVSPAPRPFLAQIVGTQI